MKIRDYVSRDYLLSLANKDGAYGYVSAHEIINAPSVENKAEWLDDVKSEIDKAQESYQTSTAYDEGVRFGLMLAYQIVDRYKAESEGTHDY